VTSLLRISAIETLYFDRIYALFGVSIEIEEGEIFTVLGPNGAGKTTLLRTIAGLLKDQPKKGEILFRGRRIDGWPPEAVARLGVVYVPEDRGLFKELTVEENLRLGLWGRHDDGVAADRDFVYDMFPILRERARQQAETLSGGEQQMLAIARVMMAGARIILMDEPTQGLAPTLVRHIREMIGELKRAGVTVLLVEQNARMALAVCDRGYLMEKGVIVFEGPSHELRESPVTREKLGV